MAQQKGIIKLKGTIGDITFYKSGDTYMAREKGEGMDATKLSGRKYQRTRENIAEFTTAAKAAKALRAAFNTVNVKAGDRKMVGRLTALFLKVVQADLTSTRGQRNVLDGETEMLQYFEFNMQGPLDTTIKAPYTATINRATGKCNVVIAPFIPENSIVAPENATHFRIVSAGAEVDFENGSSVVGTAYSGMMPWINTETVALDLESSVTPASTHPLFIALGIEFYQEVNGIKYTLKSGAFNSLKLVKVNGGV